MKTMINKQPYYIKIKEIMNRLDQTGLLTRMQNNCLSSCDLVQNLLHQVGIGSKIVEVQLTVTKQRGENAMPDHVFFGYDNISFNGQLDTHTVIITDTAQPLLIDASLGHILKGTAHKYVLVELEKNKDYLADFELDDLQLTYQVKRSPRLPQLHQKNMLDRILEEQSTRDTIKWLKVAVIGTVALGLVNFVLNSVLVVLKMLYL